MTKDQIKYLRSNFNADNGKGKTTAGSVFYVFEHHVTFRDRGDFVVFDDANELVHCISANANMPIKTECPFSVISSAYENLQFVEANLTFEGLVSLLEKMFSSLMKPEQIELVKNWADKLPAHYEGVNSNVGDYWMDKAPKIPRSTVESSWVRPVEEKDEDTEKNKNDDIEDLPTTPSKPRDPNPEIDEDLDDPNSPSNKGENGGQTNPSEPVTPPSEGKGEELEEKDDLDDDLG